ncbi:hypothetical protein PUMCH_000375 [Australozyma saopauloensis]|uniref:F-box domain-containing protein n=1 Tax=Australozyma saopauloensis TaxID=291208 RepID=A0AAX4H3Q8_9ASCO|nr:hypothetical protein PUMCH_000375 [[Candida] saopauloensis]
MFFTDLPTDILSQVFSHLPTESLKSFLQCRDTYVCAYHQIQTTLSVEIKIESPEFDNDHHDFGLYAPIHERRDILCTNFRELTPSGNLKVLRKSSLVLLQADFGNNFEFAALLLLLIDVWRRSNHKVLELHLKVSTQSSLQACLEYLTKFSDLLSLTLSLKLEICEDLFADFASVVHCFQLESINIFITSPMGMQRKNEVRIELNNCTRRFKLKSSHNLTSLQISGSALEWLELDLPMTYDTILKSMNLTEFTRLTDLRLFKIQKAPYHGLCDSFPKISSLRRLYLGFAEKLHGIDFNDFFHHNGNLEYLFFADEKTTSSKYKK